MNLKNRHLITRRDVLKTTGAALAAGAAVPVVAAATETKVADKPVMCLFSKALQKRPANDLPRMLAELGIDAVDLTVRPGGHVSPEQVTEDLPKACESLKAAGIRVPMITTGITDADKDHAEAILATAAKLGIRYAKIGYYFYKDLSKIQATLANARARLKDVAALCKQYGVTAGFHNHSGTFVGAALWDEWQLIRDLEPSAIGSYFDVGHATAEGALAGWRIGLNLLMPRIAIVGVKDMCYKKDPAKGWQPVWGPLGEGMVRFDETFKRLKEHGFSGPIALHVEYGPYTAPADSEEEKNNIEYIRHDWAYLREVLKKARMA